jgi:hypothetical protein
VGKAQAEVMDIMEIIKNRKWTWADHVSPDSLEPYGWQKKSRKATKKVER